LDEASSRRSIQEFPFDLLTFVELRFERAVSESARKITESSIFPTSVISLPLTSAAIQTVAISDDGSASLLDLRKSEAHPMVGGRFYQLAEIFVVRDGDQFTSYGVSFDGVAVNYCQTMVTCFSMWTIRGPCGVTFFNRRSLMHPWGAVDPL
jgi:hypothetical protein